MSAGASGEGAGWQPQAYSVPGGCSSVGAMSGLLGALVENSGRDGQAHRASLSPLSSRTLPAVQGAIADRPSSRRIQMPELPHTCQCVHASSALQAASRAPVALAPIAAPPLCRTALPHPLAPLPASGGSSPPQSPAPLTASQLGAVADELRGRRTDARGERAQRFAAAAAAKLVAHLTPTGLVCCILGTQQGLLSQPHRPATPESAARPLLPPLGLLERERPPGASGGPALRPAQHPRLGFGLAAAAARRSHAARLAAARLPLSMEQYQEYAYAYRIHHVENGYRVVSAGIRAGRGRARRGADVRRSPLCRRPEWRLATGGSRMWS